MNKEIKLKPRSLGFSKISLSSDYGTIPENNEPLTLNLDQAYRQYKTLNKGKFRKTTKGAFGGKEK